MTLAEFLTARLDEDEAVAKCALMWQQEGHAVFIAHYGAEWGAIDDYSPALALREVEAGRKILALHQISTTWVDSRDDDYRPVKVPEVQCYVCGWASDVEGSACETLRALAAVYSDNPGYREEWKP